MEPQSPVVVGLEPYQILLGADQPEVRPLAALRGPSPSYPTLSRWVPTPEERQLIAEGADIFVTLYTFGQPYPPTLLQVMRATADAEMVREEMQLDRELNERLCAIYARQQQETKHDG